MSQPGDKSNANRPTRRDFLKTSGAVASAAMAGNLAVARAAHAQGSDVLKVGLIGCGGRGTGAAANALSADKNTKLVAMADLFQEKVYEHRKLLQNQLPAQVAVDDDHCFVGFDAYQKLIDCGVDVVVLGEVPHYRPQHLAAAIDAGKHVFCEKPVAVDAPGVRSVLASAEKARQKGLSLVSGLCWRYHPAIRETLQKIADGDIGPIRSIHTSYVAGLVGGQTPRAACKTEMEYQARNWWFFAWLSGDFNVEQHVHSLDKAAWALGDQTPVAAWGLGGRQVPNFNDQPKTGNIYDHHAVVYEYPNEVKVHSYCRQQANCCREIIDVFAGATGTVKIDWDKCFAYDMSGKRTWRYRGRPGNMYQLEHDALFKAIREGKPINNGQYMANSTLMGILGRMCTYTGQRITWEEAMNSQETLAPSAYTFDANPPALPDKDGRYPIAVPGITKFF